jgi:foldase protein PrsA
MVPGTDGKYYVVEVVENDASNMKDEVITALAGLSDMSTTAEESYFKKYKFHIYDKPLYDAVMESYPNYIVQNQK